MNVNDDIHLVAIKKYQPVPLGEAAFRAAETDPTLKTYRFKLFEWQEIPVLVGGGKVYYPERYHAVVEHVLSLDHASISTFIWRDPVPVDALDEALYRQLSQTCQIQRGYSELAGGMEVWICRACKEFYYLRKYKQNIEDAIFNTEHDPRDYFAYHPELVPTLSVAEQKAATSPPLQVTDAGTGEGIRESITIGSFDFSRTLLASMRALIEKARTDVERVETWDFPPGVEVTPRTIKKYSALIATTKGVVRQVPVEYGFFLYMDSQGQIFNSDITGGQAVMADLISSLDLRELRLKGYRIIGSFHTHDPPDLIMSLEDLTEWAKAGDTVIALGGVVAGNPTVAIYAKKPDAEWRRILSALRTPLREVPESTGGFYIRLPTPGEPDTVGFIPEFAPGEIERVEREVRALCAPYFDFAIINLAQMRVLEQVGEGGPDIADGTGVRPRRRFIDAYVVPADGTESRPRRRFIDAYVVR